MSAPLMMVCKQCLPTYRKTLPLFHRVLTSSAEAKTTKVTDGLKAVVGLEIHAQINAKSKLFSSASAQYGASPNTNVSYFDAALPGTLPVLNKYCVEAAVKTALTFGCKINKRSSFDRKHYFYADMPAGYQITQHRHPIATGGAVDYVIYVRGRDKKASMHKARLHQIQLEQDSGKSIHDPENHQSLVDLNRAGVALMEIVTEPDFENGEQAAAFVREVQASLKLINTCDGKMEQGSLRVDANVSVHEPDSPYGVRTEVKNLNSIKSVQQAVDYEIYRQKRLVSRGGEVINMTMSFDAASRRTVAMRDKERLQDYRFMAEPNLPPIMLSDEKTSNPHVLGIDTIRDGLPELLPSVRMRFLDYDLSLEQTSTVMELQLVETIDEMLGLSSRDSKEIAGPVFNLLIQTVAACCGERKCSIEDLLSVVRAEQLLELWTAFDNNTLTDKSCKQILHRHLDDVSTTIQVLIDSGEFTRIMDRDEIRRRCENAVNDNPAVVKRLLKRKNRKEFAELVAYIQAATSERIDYNDLSTTLHSYLDSLSEAR